jgi:hypothetical protein
VEHRVERMLGEQLLDQPAIADVAMNYLSLG